MSSAWWSEELVTYARDAETGELMKIYMDQYDGGPCSNWIVCKNHDKLCKHSEPRVFKVPAKLRFSNWLGDYANYAIFVDIQEDQVTFQYENGNDSRLSISEIPKTIQMKVVDYHRGLEWLLTEDGDVCNVWDQTIVKRIQMPTQRKPPQID